MQAGKNYWGGEGRWGRTGTIGPPSEGQPTNYGVGHEEMVNVNRTTR